MHEITSFEQFPDLLWCQSPTVSDKVPLDILHKESLMFLI